MKKLSILTLTAGAAALAAGAAFAGHHEGKDKMDHADHQAKMDAKVEEKFAEVDADGNGQITQEEYMAYKMAEAEKSWADHADYIGDDNQVSLDEAKAYHNAKMAEKKDKKSMGDRMGEMKDKMEDKMEEMVEQ